jgi:EmrB/QacA subfamily drug resistance transporter
MLRGPSEPRPPLVLAATVLSAMLVMANVSVLNVALPVLLPELGATQAQGHWMVDVYAVVLASLLLPVGAIGDRFGRRLILLVGLVIMVGANAITMTLDTPIQLIVARGVSGVGAAFIFPATLSTITATLPSSLRARGIALWTAAVSVGGFVGIIGSGLLIENFRWPSLFLAMTIASLAVLAFCLVVVPDSSDPSEANLDPVGGLLAAIGIGALVLGIIEGPVEGWTAPLTLAGFGIGVSALVGFIVWEARNSRPLLDVRLFLDRGTRAGALSVFTQFLGAFGVFFLVVFYLGLVLGYGPLSIGLSLIPISIGLVPASVVAIPLAKRVGRRIVGTMGLGIMAAGFIYGTTMGVDSGLRHFLIAMIIMGVGFGFAGPPATDAIVESLPPAKQGVASALNDVVRELGAAIGVAIAGAAFNAAYRGSISDIEGYPAEVVDAVRESPFALPVVAADLGELAPALIADVQQATIDGWVRGLWALSIIMVIGAIGFAVWAPARSGMASETPVRSPAPPVPIPQAALLSVDLTPVPSGPGPLGAMELAAAAEQQLTRVNQSVSVLDHAIEVLELRTAVPPDMAGWPAAEQVTVAERAAIAMTEPLSELENRAAMLQADLRACDELIAGARAELVRLSRDPGSLREMDRLIADNAQGCELLARRLAHLEQRFSQVAALFSTLRPAAGQIAGVRPNLDACRTMLATWAAGTALRPPSLDVGSPAAPTVAQPRR